MDFETTNGTVDKHCILNIAKSWNKQTKSKKTKEIGKVFVPNVLLTAWFYNFRLNVYLVVYYSTVVSDLFEFLACPI